MAEQALSIVDWEAVREELDGIDESWKQPRFDSLSHVVEVLTSHDPEEATRTLREQRDAIEALVDDVVRGYHKGFNKAIHNYSQILRLFSESAASLSGLKVNLATSKSLLGTRHKQLQQQWYRSVILRNVISLLDQIDNVSKVPAKIEHLIAEKKYYAAVQLHIQSINMLEREGIQGVGALQEVRSDLSKLRGTLFFKVIEDLHLHLYNKGEYSINISRLQNVDDDLSNIEAIIPPSQTMSRRTRTFKRIDTQDLRLTSSSDVSSSVDGKDVDSQNGDAADSGASENGYSRYGKSLSNDEIKETVKAKRSAPMWLADAIPNEFIESVTKSDASANVKYLQAMVECLSLLGKIAAGGAIISQRLRQTVHDIIADGIKAHAASVESSRPRPDEVSKVPSDRVYRLNGTVSSAPAKQKALQSIKPKKSRTTSSLASLIGPTGPAQASAHELLESIFDTLSHVLENHVTVGEALEAKVAALPESSEGGSTGGYGIPFTLSVIQSECQQLICDILRASPDAASADAAAQSARLASKTPTEKSNGGSEDGLSFAFRFSDAVMAIPGDGLSRNPTGDILRAPRRRPTTGQEGYGTGAVISDRGIYLTAAVYRPIVQFTDKIASLLPSKHAQLGKEGLQTFIENFIKDQFLPILYVDYRTRAADALASSAAFRPKAPPSASIERSKIMLLGPSVADQLAKEVIGWAHAMPKHAGEFLELVQTILERTLERCRAAYTEAVLGSLSCSIIGETEVEKLMTQEPASALLGNVDANDGLTVDTMLDADALEVEAEMNNLLISYRPVKQEQLIKDDQKLVLLAALSESLDLLATSVERLGQKSPALQKIKDRPHRHKRSSSSLTSALHVLTEKYHGLALECLRALRVEMQLQALFHGQSMQGRVYVSDQDAEEPEDFVVAFTTQITRWDEEMTPYVPPAKRNYIFGGICGIAATSFIKALNDMSLVSVFGVRQICRNCIALQQALAALSSSSNEMVQQRLDRVRTYYELLTMPFEALMAFVAEHDTLFTFSEYSALLKVNVPGREVPADAVQRIGKVLAP